MAGLLFIFLIFQTLMSFSGMSNPVSTMGPSLRRMAQWNPLYLLHSIATWTFLIGPGAGPSPLFLYLRNLSLLSILKIFACLMILRFA